MSTDLSRNNRQKFVLVKELNLPQGDYAITGSGPLGIRNLREVGDIDIIVNPKLWSALAAEYGIEEENHVKKVIFPGGIIEALGEISFQTIDQALDKPTIIDRIAQAEIIDGLPFESLEHVVYFKKKMGRKKDLEDIKLIQGWLEINSRATEGK